MTEVTEINMDNDLPDEIKLEADHSGSAKRIRAGRKHMLMVLGGARDRQNKQPLWLRQLRIGRGKPGRPKNSDK
jgi:hypothetical protein